MNPHFVQVESPKKWCFKSPICLGFFTTAGSVPNGATPSKIETQQALLLGHPVVIKGQASEITWNQSMMQIPIVGRSIANPQENSCKCCFQSFEGWSRYSSSNYFYNGDLPTTNHEDIPREKQTCGKKNTQFCEWKVSLQTANGRLVSGQFKIRSNTMSPFPCSSRWGPTSSHESG